LVLSFQTKMASALAVASLCLLLVLSAVCYSPSASSSSSSSPSQREQQQHRYLEEDANNNNNSNNNDGDYSSYSCGSIRDVAPEPGSERCSFARTCNGGSGVWAPFVFCYSGVLSSATLLTLLSPVMLLWLVVLFRMLGSTAEDYFSPALEMFSVQLGLPPRFAGVTLLALGNGAADVSATISAITGDPESGYMLSLGALTGAAMMIGGVVSALVIIAADGVYCRGALVRDVLALFVTVVVVWWRLSTGVVGPETITLFISMYAVFVVLVLVADIYHRAVVLPRRAELAQERERQRQFQEAERLRQQGILPADGDLQLPPSSSPGGGTAAAATSSSSPHLNRGSRISNVITALSNYDTEPVADPMAADAAAANGGDGWGIDSEDLAHQRPVMLHGAHGILGHPHRHRAGAGAAGGEAPEAAGGGYSMLEDASPTAENNGESMADGLMRMSMTSTGWRNLFDDARLELLSHASSVWEDIVWNGDVHPVEKFLLLCELPITALRKVSVPIPCEGYYVRAMVALSMAVSPGWFAYYLWRSNDVNVFSFWQYYLIYWITMIIGAVAVLRFAPAGSDSDLMSVYGSVPIALYGFVIAATWIDTIADSLVSLLNFIGIILNIPTPVLGLTLLAWGNSMSDLSANMTMARKGLANMAMTACFAGPVFNILVGLGLGFSSLAAISGKAERNVSLSPSVLTGFFFITVNAALILTAGLFFGKGRIVKQYGYLSLALYAVYVISSISLQFSKYGDN